MNKVEPAKISSQWEFAVTNELIDYAVLKREI
jgi:hypothetical protein